MLHTTCLLQYIRLYNENLYNERLYNENFKHVIHEFCTFYGGLD